ncbi:hypothetical protein MED222_06340 [Vibrio sp. MED222]|nr:hypothetical protein MED222_06340 [Vibrio sp. MED222]
MTSKSCLGAVTARTHVWADRRQNRI